MKKHKTMLVAEDSEINRGILCEIFGNDYDILEAKDGIETMIVLKENKDNIDILLLDLVMPQMDGFQVLEEISKDSELSPIPIIVVTEYSSPEVEVKALKLGALDLVNKPYNPYVITQRVKNAVIRKELEYRKSQAQEERYKIIVEQSGTIVFEWNFETNEFYSSEGFAEFVLGNENNNKIFNNHVDLEAVHPDDRENLKNNFFNSLDKIKGHSEITLRLKKVNGEFVWCKMSATFIRDKDKKVIRAIGTINIIDNEIRAIEELKKRAEYDDITGLFNKESFYQNTMELLKGNSDIRYILYCVDIERFSIINDMFGMDEGDKLLEYIGSYFREHIDFKTGTAARIAGDVFAACVPFYEGIVKSVEEELRNFLRKYPLDFDILFDIGFYKINNPPIPINLMCDRANLALNTVKGNYLRNYAFYNEALRDTLLHEQEIINVMEKALLEEQFEVYLQPIYNIVTGKIVSAEALVRWNHPEKGLVAPDNFIPIFEHNGFIMKLDYYMWEHVCINIKEWKESNKPIVPISVNVSRVNFYNPSFSSEMINLVKKYNIEPELFKLEITESAYTENETQLLKVMKHLQDYGFKILMDDFGSGYSSLNMLKNVPVDILKIDMRFLEDVGLSARGESILTSVVHMARGLKLPIIAEGVEKIEQVSYLKSIGCDNIQGYYFSKPLSIEAFQEILKKNEALSIDDNYVETLYKNTDFNIFWDVNPESKFILDGIIDAIGIFEIFDGKIEIIRANNGYYELMGCTPHSFLEGDNNFLNLIQEEDIDLLIKRSKFALEYKNTQDIKIRLNKKAAVDKLLDMKIKYLGKDKERLIYCFTITDISGNKIT